MDVLRRDFLTGSLATIAGGRLAGSASAAPAATPIYRTLGRTGLKLPIVSMGVMNADQPGIVRRAYEVGMRHFDTAAVYRYGRNEELLGGVIKELGVREKVVITTKALGPELHRDIPPAHAGALLVDIFEGSLRRLQTDYVDILLLHAALNANHVRNEGILEALTTLKKQGKARFIGLSPHDKIVEVIETATQLGVHDVMLVTINYTMRDDKALLGAIDAAAKKGIGIIAMKTQAGGRMKPEDQKRLPVCSQTALLKWVLRNPAIATAVPGFSTYEHLEQDWSAAFSLDYTREEEAFLADKSYFSNVQFCRQCSSCVPDCPFGADIPTLMRSHMYAVRYGNREHARQTLAGIVRGKGLDACQLCPTCTAACRRTVDIPGNIAELRGLALA